MKRFLLLVLLSANLLAETPLEKEFQQLTQNQEKALGEAITPIHRRYQEALLSLQRRAATAKDSTTEALIRRALGPVAIPTTAISPSNNRTAAHVPGDWTLPGVGNMLKFWADGNATIQGNAYIPETKMKWKMEPTGLVSVVNGEQKVAYLKFDGGLRHFTGTDWNGKPWSGIRK